MGSDLCCGWLQCTTYLLYWAWQIWSVLPVCKNCGYVVKFYCCWTWQIWINGRLWSERSECLVHLVCMNRLESFVVCIGKMAQDVGLGWRESVVVSIPSSLIGFWGFHPYMRHLFSFRKLFVHFCCFFYMLLFVAICSDCQFHMIEHTCTQCHTTGASAYCRRTSKTERMRLTGISNMPLWPGAISYMKRWDWAGCKQRLAVFSSNV